MRIHPVVYFFNPEFHRKRSVKQKLKNLIAVGIFFQMCSAASALMVPLATTTLVDRAACIVEGQIVNVASHWTDDHSAIVTEVAVDVDEILLGDTNRVVFSYEGGIVGNLEQRVSDMPRLKSGQRILVFLREERLKEAKRVLRIENESRRYTLVGAAQGVCHIEGECAIKSGFTLVRSATVIDRDVEVSALKTQIRERLVATRRERGEP